MVTKEITVSDIAKLFNVRPALVKLWGKLFAEFMTPATTQPGKRRTYTQEDIRVLALVYEMKEWDNEDSDEDYSEIFSALNSGDHFEKRFQDLAFFSTPIFQGPPEGLDETWTHGVLVGGMALLDNLSIAQQFKRAADVLEGVWKVRKAVIKCGYGIPERPQ